MKTVPRLLSLVLLLGIVAALPAQADLVRVEVTGTVLFNEFFPPITFNLLVVRPGDTAVVAFLVDSENFIDAPEASSRFYEIDQASYSLTFNAATGPVVERLRDPYPFGFTPFFVLSNDIPQVDLFAVTSISPFEQTHHLFLSQTGGTLLEDQVAVTYDGDTIQSVDILDALGTYGRLGLSQLGLAIVDGERNRMEFRYNGMTISRVVPVDFRPGECPNPLNPKSHGKLPLAILGTPDLAVTQIDPASIRLNGVAPLRSSLADVGTPFEPFAGRSDCTADCDDPGGDGLTDLVLQFDTQAVAATLGHPAKGDCVVLQVTGNLRDGDPIYSEDVARIVGAQH